MKVKKIISKNVEDVFDIEMPSFHNFILENGTIAHNCSHAVSYSYITYATAFLKHYYPLEWWSAVLTHEDENEINQNLLKYVSDIVRAPDINTSQKEMAPDYTTNTIRQRLTLLKGIADNQADKIIANRPYSSVKDVVKRSECSLSLLKKLAHVGVLDSLFEPETPTERKIYLLNKAKIEVDHEEKLAQGKKPKAMKEPEVDEDYICLTPLADYQIKKSIFPSMQIDLHSIALKSIPSVNNLGRFPFCSVNNKDYKFFSGKVLKGIDENNVNEEVTIASVGYIMKMEEFSYQGGAKKALKIFIDCSGYVSEKVLWPDRETGVLSYPENLKKGAIALFVFNKRPNKPYTNIYDLQIVKETIDKPKKKK